MHIISVRDIEIQRHTIIVKCRTNMFDAGTVN